jgi:hypothetical protein
MTKEIKEYRKYTEADRIAAMQLLHKSVRVDEQSKVRPNFPMVSQVLKVPQDFLYDLWKKRDQYEPYLHEALIDANLTLAIKMNEVMFEILDEIKIRGIASLTHKDLLKTFNDFQAHIRLATGQSSQNISIKMSGNMNIVSDDHVTLPPKPDTPDYIKGFLDDVDEADYEEEE